MLSSRPSSVKRYADKMEQNKGTGTTNEGAREDGEPLREQHPPEKRHREDQWASNI